MRRVVCGEEGLGILPGRFMMYGASDRLVPGNNLIFRTKEGDPDYLLTKSEAARSLLATIAR